MKPTCIYKVKRKYFDLSEMDTNLDIDNVTKQFSDIYLTNQHEQPNNYSCTNYDVSYEASDEEYYDILNDNFIIRPFKKTKISKYRQQNFNYVFKNYSINNSINIINSLKCLNKSFDKMEKLINNKITKLDSQIKLLNKSLDFINSKDVKKSPVYLSSC
jgi:hypothetical protein